MTRHSPKEFKKAVIFLMEFAMTSIYSRLAQSWWICRWIASLCRSDAITIENQIIFSRSPNESIFIMLAICSTVCQPLELHSSVSFQCEDCFGRKMSLTINLRNLSRQNHLTNRWFHSTIAKYASTPSNYLNYGEQSEIFPKRLKSC